MNQELFIVHYESCILCFIAYHGLCVFERRFSFLKKCVFV